MTRSEMLVARSNAIAHFTYPGYQQLLRVGERYMNDNNIPIPSDGIEHMPSFWATVNQLIHEETKAKPTCQPSCKIT
jgi:hypothetical protein